MKKQTAVEWLEQRLNVYFNKKLDSSLWKIKEKFEQAKNMEKQQIINAHGNKYYQDKERIVTGNQYFNDTYK
jgi:hypothetical protein